MIRMCQNRFIDCNKCSTLLQDVGRGIGNVLVGQGIYENPVLSSQFCYESKIVLENKIDFKKDRSTNKCFNVYQPLNHYAK